MNEAEEFEFRLRMEQEAAATPPAATEPPSALAVAGNAAWKGLAGVADFPLNIAGAVGNALIPPALRPGVMQNPISEGMKAVGLITPEHEPQTPGQRILDLAVQAGVGTAISPGSVVRNAIVGTISGTGAGIAKEATGSDAAATAVAVATPLLTRGGSGARASTSLNSTTLKTAQDGMKAGYVIPPSKVNPSLISNAVESIGGKASTKQAANATNIATTDRLAAEELGIKGELTPDAINSVKSSASQVYANIAALSPRAKAALERLSESRLDASDNWKDYATGASKGRADSRKAALAADAKSTQYERVIEREARAAGQPGLVQELRQARVTLAKVHNIEDAMNVGDGHVSASYLGRLLDNGKPLTGNLKTIGRFSQAFPDISRDASRVPFAGVSALDATMAAGLGTAGYYGSGGDPQGAALGALPLLRGPARAALLSKSTLGIPGTTGYQQRLLRNPPELNQAVLQSILAGRSIAEAR